MGCSIATCILSAGHRVTSLVRNTSEADAARLHILNFLKQLHEEKLLAEDPGRVMERLFITTEVKELSNLDLVIESITEDVEEKKKVYRQLEAVLPPTAIIGSNTSAIPVTVLQKGLYGTYRITNEIIKHIVS